MNNTSYLYRSEIDGLRALSVLLVVLYHADFFFFSGGFVGVDIFFVLSGYLISLGFYNDISNNGKLNILSFYVRRIRRLIPAIFFLIIIIIPLAVYFLPLEHLSAFGKNIIYTALFIPNIMFGIADNYFDVDLSVNPLIHMWSLGVEEQFYLVFPLLLAFSISFFRNKLFLIVCLFVLISFLYSVLFKHFSLTLLSQSYYDPLSRFWELGVGSLLAYLHFHKLILPSKSHILGVLSVILILSSAFYYSDADFYPSYMALVPVLGALLFINSDSSYLKCFFSNYFLRYIGLISFSFYLWHLPVVSFFKLVYESHFSFFYHGIISISIAFILASFSYYIVEKPFRYTFLNSSNKAFYLFVSYFLFSVFSGLYIYKNSKMSSLEFASELYNGKALYSDNLDERKIFSSYLAFQNISKDTIVMGSSRLMPVNSSFFSGDLFNLSVSSAVTEDYISLLPPAFKCMSPKVIYIGVDPWVFSSSGNARWKSNVELYSSGLDFLSSGTLQFKCGSIIPSLFSNPISHVNRYGFSTSDFSIGSQSKILPDGSKVFSHNLVDKEFSIIKKRFPKSRNNIFALSEDYSNSNDFFKLAKLLRQSGAQVNFVLSPYHPSLFSQEGVSDKLDNIESMVLSRAFDAGINVFGSYNSSRIGCDSSQFIDGIHPNAKCLMYALNFRR